jgi:hypothetical protein
VDPGVLQYMSKLQMKELWHDDTLETKGGTALKRKRPHSP